MTQVKICGLTSLEDARWACRCGANLLGVNFVPTSPRCVEPQNAARMGERPIARNTTITPRGTNRCMREVIAGPLSVLAGSRVFPA